jgi:hypothetical protein
MKITPMWSTPIGFGNFDSIELAQHILTNYNLDNPPSEARDENLFDNSSSYITNFRKIVYNAFDEYLQDTVGRKISDWNSYTLKGWITGHGKDYQMTIHNHSGAQLSGVFYIMAEDEKSGGDIVFSDPRSNSNRGYDEWFECMFERYTHSPKSGEYLIFPSFTYHHVNPYYSKLRIAVPVDLYLHRS